MADFPGDVIRLIFSHLTQETLVECRLLCRSLEPLAAGLVFRSVRLERARDVDPFLNIARSERLRPLVRELTLDLTPGGTPTSDAAEYGVRVQQHLRTIRAFPLVRLFSGLRTLNLRYKGSGDNGHHGGYSGRRVDYDGAEIDPRFLPLLYYTIYTETVLRCISGSWTMEAQERWDGRWRAWSTTRAAALENLSLTSSLRDEPGFFDTEQSFPEKAINLRTLTISNLSEKDSEYLMSSAAMKRFLETQTLCHLKILTTTENYDPDCLSPFSMNDRYDFFENLPSSWLSPPIADRLRTLSLFACEYWGWAPKMDFRLLSQGKNGTGGLPNLRSLALGRFVFTHQWQVDWVAQLGSDNGRGGLEELYLDDCPIMWRAQLFGPADSEGFPSRWTMRDIGKPPSVASPAPGHPVTVDFALRWCTVLREWRQKMPSLAVFKMGRGDWEGLFCTHVAMAQTASRARVVDGQYMMAKHRAENTVHLNYDKFSIDDDYERGQGTIRDGVGMFQRRGFVLRYVHFQAAFTSSPWEEEDFKRALMGEFDDGNQRYEEALHKDEDALYLLRASIGFK